MTGPASARLSARLAVSASQVKDFDRCERAWFLASVARAPDDANAGGSYLAQGDLYDEAGQRHQARMGVDAEDLVAAVRAKSRGGALALDDDQWLVMAERAQRMLRATAHHLPEPKTASVQHKYRIVVPGYEDRGGVVVTGKTDFRRPGLVWDTKSTTDRGPGRGRDAKTPPYALTDASTPGGNVNPLADDVQASLYAWCEFMLDPLRLSVRCRWVYASKPSTGSPQGWAVEHVFTRADCLAWFDSYVRPRIDRMLELLDASEIVLAPEAAAANHNGCARCFRKLSCSPFTGLQEPLKEGQTTMAFDLKAARAAQAARAAGVVPAPAPVAPPEPPSLAGQLEESVRALAARVATHPEDRRADIRIQAPVAVNRPDAPPNLAAPLVLTGVREVSPEVAATLRPVLDTVGVEAPADPKGPSSAVPGAEAPTSLTSDSGAASLSESTEALALSPGVTTATDRPARGRGRPRKGAAGPSDAPPASAARVATERLEAIATQAQTVADAAASLVELCNAELRALGVRL